jgi:hypothetical protein
MWTPLVGEDRGGELGGEVGQGGPASGLDGDAEGAESFGEPFAGDRLSGQQSGEQPFAGGGRADAGVGLAVGEEGEQQVAEGPGTGRSCWPSWMVTPSWWRVTWLVVRAAIRVVGWPNSRTRHPATRSVVWTVSASARIQATHETSADTWEAGRAAGQATRCRSITDCPLAKAHHGTHW